MRPTNEHSPKSNGYGLRGKRMMMTSRPIVLQRSESRQTCNIRTPGVTVNGTDEPSVEHVAMLGDK